MEEAVITGTGFAGVERQEVRAAAQACGATYSGEHSLNPNHCV